MQVSYILLYFTIFILLTIVIASFLVVLVNNSYKQNFYTKSRFCKHSGEVLNNMGVCVDVRDIKCPRGTHCVRTVVSGVPVCTSVCVPF